MKVLFISFLVLAFFQINVFAQEPLRYLNFHEDLDSDTNKVSYEIFFSQGVIREDVFESQVYFNDKKVESFCNGEIIFDDSTLFRKITCEVPKMGDGEYLFIGLILRDGDAIYKTINRELILKESSASLSFVDEEDYTIVKIKPSSTGVNKELIHKIPKEAIELITTENEDKLESSHPFRIIEEDPIIAWDLEAVNNDEIEYKIEGKLSPEVREDFTIKIQEKTKESKNLEYFLMFAIFIIILLVIKPLFKKKKD